ncbi:hypothetical protein SAMN03080601_02605 [Alkalitalea saponilacus]|uniref:Uncharacterized protein n=1 Tax=Alkalitalea saponilacus TaxID=889453 RepID=A0A1T5HQI6_9BACT|nr:hypothetical protein SAMN03080601_02605 [Alkalitalea saponilacus]
MELLSAWPLKVLMLLGLLNACYKWFNASLLKQNNELCRIKSRCFNKLCFLTILRKKQSDF